MTMWHIAARGSSLALKGIIYVYQLLLSPVLGNNCRFHPNCSSYAMEAIDRHGALRGSWLAVKRVGRCNPWHSGGADPVPDGLNGTPIETITLAPGGSAGR